MKQNNDNVFNEIHVLITITKKQLEIEQFNSFFSYCFYKNIESRASVLEYLDWPLKMFHFSDKSIELSIPFSLLIRPKFHRTRSILRHGDGIDLNTDTVIHKQRPIRLKFNLKICHTKENTRAVESFLFSLDFSFLFGKSKQKTFFRILSISIHHCVRPTLDIF